LHRDPTHVDENKINFRSDAVRQRIGIALASIAFLLSAVAATAQEGRAELSVQGTGFFTKDTNGHGTFQRGTESGGVMVGYRRHLYRWISAEAVYGYSRNTQDYFQSVLGGARVQSNIHEATGGFVVKLPFIASLRPYALAEGGALVFAPTHNAFGSFSGAQRDAEGVFVYGAGVDHPLLGSRLLLRAEYRGLVYHAPNFGLISLNTGGLTHTAQPSAGVVFRF
jgi:hypothetical protein